MLVSEPQTELLQPTLDQRSLSSVLHLADYPSTDCQSYQDNLATRRSNAVLRKIAATISDDDVASFHDSYCLQPTSTENYFNRTASSSPECSGTHPKLFDADGIRKHLLPKCIK
jgi:hypothetical protein